MQRHVPSVKEGHRPGLVVVDLRNNYGGVIQDAMDMAAMLLFPQHSMYAISTHGAERASRLVIHGLESSGDGHRKVTERVVCYTNSLRSGVTPRAVEDVITDPGAQVAQGFLLPLLSSSHRGVVCVLYPTAAAPASEEDVAQQSLLHSVVMLGDAGTTSAAEVFSAALQQAEASNLH